MFPSCHSEIRKLPCFDVEVPEPCLEKWKACYENYRAEMSLALQGDRECKNEAANQVIKKYKKVMLKKFVLNKHEKQFSY